MEKVIFLKKFLVYINIHRLLKLKINSIDKSLQYMSEIMKSLSFSVKQKINIKNKAKILHCFREEEKVATEICNREC